MRQPQQQLPSTIHQRTQVDNGYKYPTARVPSDSYAALQDKKDYVLGAQQLTSLLHTRYMPTVDTGISHQYPLFTGYQLLVNYSK